MASATYAALDKAWRSTCRVLFGQEVGGLADFEEWLEENAGTAPRLEKSALSGKGVELAVADYAPGQRFASFDELDFGRKFAPLSINEVKDMDSIVDAVRERVFYAGNIILGSSSHVEESSNIIDSHFIYRSNVVSDSKYIACSKESRFCEYCFGHYVGGKSSHCIRVGGGMLTRCFECYHCENNSDCYFGANLQNCREAMFCFGANSKSYAIGNLALGKEKYLAIKKKLLSELSEELRKKHRTFSLLKLIEKAGGKGKSRLKLLPGAEPAFSKAPIEESFSATTKLLLGKSLRGMDSFSGYLQRHVPKNIFLVSPLSGKKVVVAGYRFNIFEPYNIRDRTLDYAEMLEIGRTSVEEGALHGAKLDMGWLAGALAPVAYAALDQDFGNISNSADSAVLINCQDCYMGSAYVDAKKCAFCHWPRESEHVFGSSAIWLSSFCMKCFYSKKLSRCLEADNCDSCSDLYFSHNCENVRDSMFCFNVKNLKCAIGNAVLPTDQYKRVKGALVAQMADELEKKKNLKWDIFTIGARH